MNYIIGQSLGLIASCGSMISPFFKKKWMMLVNTIVANTLVALNFLLIGQIGSAIFLNLVAVVQGAVSLYHIRTETRINLFEKIIFLLLYVGLGVTGIVTAPDFVWEISAKNLIEILPIGGALFLMIGVFVRDEQKTRAFGLCNNILWITYDAIIGTTAIFGPAFGLISNISALYKYRKRKE